MEIKDTRITAKYEGATSEGIHIFTNVNTKRTFKVLPDAISGDSILAFTDVFSLRVMPGGHYLVEGMA